MPETTEKTDRKEREFRYRGRGSQIPIYLGKQLRFFINESDWKVLPMAAVIAALVAMVVRRRMFLNMEGTLMGAFAISCVAIWNGCFNSIQSVCREQAIIKREHRSGMHISSYVIAHMIYQFLLCLLQTAVSMYAMQLTGLDFPDPGFMTPWMIVDIGITMLLVSYAADMMSLLISSIARTTTSAMTVMPFILIFQLVFSGGVIPLPEWVKPLSGFTLSTYGMRAVAAQSGYNELMMDSVWQTVDNMKDTEIEETVTVGKLMEMADSDFVARYRDTVIIPSVTAAQASEYLNIPLADESGGGKILNEPVTLGELLDLLAESKSVQENADRVISMKTTVGELIGIIGEDHVRNFVRAKTAEAGYNPEYEHTRTNVAGNWMMLGLFILVFAALSTLVLEMIDKDKR